MHCALSSLSFLLAKIGFLSSGILSYHITGSDTLVYLDKDQELSISKDIADELSDLDHFRFVHP
jgi:hypothetical protein